MPSLEVISHSENRTWHHFFKSDNEVEHTVINIYTSFQQFDSPTPRKRPKLTSGFQVLPAKLYE